MYKTDCFDTDQSILVSPIMHVTKVLCVFLSLIAIQCVAASLEDDDYEVTMLTNEILSWVRSGHQSARLERYVEELALPTELRNVNWRTFTGARAKGMCTICKSLAKTVISLRKEGMSAETIINSIQHMCISLNLHTERVCHGIVTLQAPIVLYILDSNLDIDPSDICGILYQYESCTTVSNKYNWTMEIDENPPKAITPTDSEETMKILQLTDIHYDPMYEPKGNPHCGEPTCCRKGQNVTNDSGEVAGYWGDYNDCDVPWHSVVDALDHMKKTHQDIEAVYFTGDLIDHGVWETTQTGNTESIIKCYDTIKNTFSNIPVYPIIGNHEPHPLNVFAPSHIKEEIFSTEWLYKLSADLWIQNGWLPESTRETILQGGFYTVSPRKGFRIIALNNNVCYTYNWWLIYEPRDPNGQLRFLADTLLEAEKNNEYVHLLTHIPTGSQDCYVAWSREFRRIINRFAHIISAQFNGHTHNDEFNVYYDRENTKKMLNVAWNGGSLTPFSYVNPNYKVYTAEAKTFGIVDIDTWMFNLTAANLTPEKRPEWYRSYSFKEEYGLRDLSKESLHEWIVRMFSDVTMLDQYRKNFYKRADPSISKECDAECLKKHLCSIVRGSSDDKTPCDAFSLFS